MTYHSDLKNEKVVTTQEPENPFLFLSVVAQFREQVNPSRIFFGKNPSNRTILTYFGGQDNFIFKIVLLYGFTCKRKTLLLKKL